MLGHDAWVYRYIRLVCLNSRNIPDMRDVTKLDITNKFKGVYFSLNFFERMMYIDQQTTAVIINMFPSAVPRDAVKSTLSPLLVIRISPPKKPVTILKICFISILCLKKKKERIITKVGVSK